MMVVNTPLSFWIQASSLFFALAGVFSDLLVLRVWLFLAYLMLFINAVLGSPLWPDVSSSGGGLYLDSIIWSILSMYVHGSSLVCLLLDERAVDLNEEEAALWRMFYRTGGLSAKLFKTIVAPYLRVIEFEAGEEIPTEDYFYIVYTGRIDFKVYEHEKLKVERNCSSGEMFDLKFLGMFAAESVFVTHSIKAVTETHTTLFRFSRDDMEKISHHRLAKGVWQALLINNLSFVVESCLENTRHLRYTETYCDKIFDPLEKWEQRKEWYAGSGTALKKPLEHLVGYMHWSFSPPWPFKRHLTSIRQTLLPPPPLRPSTVPHLAPRFHRFSTMGRSLTNSRQTTPEGSRAPSPALPEEQVETGTADAQT